MKKLNNKSRRVTILVSFIFMFFMFQSNIMAQCTPESINADESEIIRLEVGETLDIDGLIIRYLESEVSENYFNFSNESIKVANNESVFMPKIDYLNQKNTNYFAGKQEKL